MTTLVLTKQDGSPTRNWREVGGKPDTPVVSQWYGYIRQEMIGSLVYEVYEHLPTYEDASTETEVQTEFEQLAAEWKRETAHLSSPNAIAGHRAYQEIIGMGEKTISFILRDLQETRDQWFWALSSIARESPVQPEDLGDVDAMTKAWVDWGKQRRYIGKAEPSFKRGEFDGSPP